MEEYTVRMRDAVPGASVRGEVMRRRRNDIEARVLEVLESGPHHVEPRCSHFGTCGGCSRQDLAYEAQLAGLGDLLGDLVRPLLEAETVVEPVLGMEHPWNYRNKMDFTFGNRRWVNVDEPEDAPRDFAVGLHVRGNYEKVLDVDTCHIAFEEASGILTTARAEARGLSAWDVRAHEGLLRHLVLRKGVHTGEILAYLVTSPGEDDRIDAYAERILAAHPEITTFVHGTNDGVATVATSEKKRVLHGGGTIHEELLGLRFEISPESFFQTNTLQAELLAARVREAAAVHADDVVFDLYCGGGALSLVMAASEGGVAPRSLTGFELVVSAVRDAEKNAAKNGIENARFVPGDLAQTLAPGSLNELGLETPTVCLVDPPRAGMHASVVEALRGLAPRRIVYVSCNPKTAVRDLALLGEDYRLTRVQPIDLFPHTPHLECIFTIERRGA